MPSTSILDDVATDLAIWLDATSDQIALAMAPTGQAPFAAPLSEQEKLNYYRDQLFNPDGTPNLQGRMAQMQRLGPQGFTQVYKAVVKAYPALRVPSPPPGAIPGAPEVVPTQVAGGKPSAAVPVPNLPRGVSTVQVGPGANT